METPSISGQNGLDLLTDVSPSFRIILTFPIILN